MKEIKEFYDSKGYYFPIDAETIAEHDLVSPLCAI